MIGTIAWGEGEGGCPFLSSTYNPHNIHFGCAFIKSEANVFGFPLSACGRAGWISVCPGQYLLMLIYLQGFIPQAHCLLSFCWGFLFICSIPASAFSGPATCASAFRLSQLIRIKMERWVTECTVAERHEPTATPKIYHHLSFEDTHFSHGELN